MTNLNQVDRQYHDLLRLVMQQPERTDRTGTGTRSLFGYQMRFENLDTCFPLITTKQVHMKSIIYELLWMLKGLTNIEYLKENKVSIWDEWADERGELGPVYGAQWRNWEANGKDVDQIATAVNSLITNPNNRRNIVSAWNPSDLSAMALPPCHLLFQFYTRELTMPERMSYAGIEVNEEWIGIQSIEERHERCDAKKAPRHYLDCQVYIRSNDLFLGAPFNIAQYALLTHLMAKTVNMVPGTLVYTIGDAHIYSNHYDQVSEQLSRESASAPPMLHIMGEAKDDPADYEYDQISLRGYTSHSKISAPVAV